MRKSDINKMADIAKLILENAGTGTGDGVENAANALYDKIGQNLRENDYRADGKKIVQFYTEKPSETENDLLHNAEGPAVIFANEAGEYDINDPNNTFYFIHGERVDPNSAEWRQAQQQSIGKATDASVSDVTRAATSGEDYDFDNM
jgi:hypothetical protein